MDSKEFWKKYANYHLLSQINSISRRLEWNELGYRMQRYSWHFLARTHMSIESICQYSKSHWQLSLDRKNTRQNWNLYPRFKKSNSQCQNRSISNPFRNSRWLQNRWTGCSEAPVCELLLHVSVQDMQWHWSNSVLHLLQWRHTILVFPRLQVQRWVPSRDVGSPCNKERGCDLQRLWISMCDLWKCSKWLPHLCENVFALWWR